MNNLWEGEYKLWLAQETERFLRVGSFVSIRVDHPVPKVEVFVDEISACDGNILLFSISSLLLENQMIDQVGEMLGHDVMSRIWFCHVPFGFNRMIKLIEPYNRCKVLRLHRQLRHKGSTAISALRLASTDGSPPSADLIPISKESGHPEFNEIARAVLNQHDCEIALSEKNSINYATQQGGLRSTLKTMISFLNEIVVGCQVNADLDIIKEGYNLYLKQTRSLDDILYSENAEDYCVGSL